MWSCYLLPTLPLSKSYSPYSTTHPKPSLPTYLPLLSLASPEAASKITSLKLHGN